MKKTENKKMYPVYGVIGMIGLFLVGIIVGYIFNGADHINKSGMSELQCKRISEAIISQTNKLEPDADVIAQLNKVYSENCLNRVFEQPKPQPKVEEKKLPEKTCEAIEELIKRDIMGENDNYWESHQANSQIYQKLAERGCPENHDKYLKLANRELNIANALRGATVAQKSTCEQIESVLIPELRCTDGYEICGNPDVHINNAKIYANLSERGCPENSVKYKELAKQELEIARALNDDNLESERQSVEIVETYKRLQMQAEAEKMIEKAKKLTNPAIDFIIQLEKIIEE